MTLDLDAIRERAAKRRENPVARAEWECHYCNKKFTNETFFLNHFCKERERYEEIRTPIGQAAYQYYCEWMKLYKRKPPAIDTFSSSRFYTSFVKFAKNAITINLPSPEMFIRLMVERDISPTLWARDQCYSIFLEYFDKNVDPFEHVQKSIEKLMDIAEKENVELGNIFMHLGPNRVIELIRLRQLSPWFLFCSAKFGEFLKSITQDEWAEIAKIVNPSYWSEKLDAGSDKVAEIINISNELGL